VTVERIVRPAGPYSLALTARHAGDATRSMRDGELTAALRIGDRVEIASARQLVDGSVVLRGQSAEGIEQLQFVLALDRGADHSDFLRRFARDPLIGEATIRFRGLRPLRLPTVAQALLRAFCGQLIESRLARALERRIVRATCPPVEGSGFHAPPTRATFAALAPARLRQLGLHERRAAGLVRISRALELDRLRELPTDAVAARLARERGVGPWSVGIVCLEGLGRYERGLVGDLALVKLMSDLRGRRVETYETAELLEPYGEWAGLAGKYLVMAYAHGLIPLPGSSIARRPPARFRVAPAAR